jgi:hypothetical protein
VPTGSVEVVKSAWRLTSVTVPSVWPVVVLVKVTEPVGVPPLAPETETVKETGWPKLLGFCDATKPVLVLALLTV